MRQLFPNLLILALAVILPACGTAPATDEVVDLCRQVMTGQAELTAELESRLDDFEGDIGTLMETLRKSQPRNWKPAKGSKRNQRFTAPHLKQKYREDRLNIFVPPGYRPDTPHALNIFLHGGGGTTPVDKIGYTTPAICKPNGKNPPRMIEVMPSAPWEKFNPFRWNLERTDAYIEAVIEECQYRFNIDPDRIFLGGHSMGGYGGYHLVQRFSDRLAGGYAWAGAWKESRWDCLHGTGFFIGQGIHDAVAPGHPKLKNRPRWTDIFYARKAHEALDRHGVPHGHHFYEGGHSMSLSGLKALRAWIRSTKPRDPFHPRVVAVTPRGWGKWGKKAPPDGPSPHCRWITIGKTTDGTIKRDRVVLEGPAPKWKETKEAWDQQSFKHSIVDSPGALVDATYLSDNRFQIKTENVTSFSIWLHPDMVDFNRDIILEIDGRTVIRRARASLADALRSYLRRRDWGLIYYCEVEISL